MSEIGKLVRYKRWANERLFAALADLTEAQLIAPQPIIFGSLLRTLHHVQAMDHVWQSHLQGTAHGLSTRNPEYCPPFGQLARMQCRADDWFVAYADGLSPPVDDELVEFMFIGGGPGAMTRAEILLHVVNHGTYHRGHVAHMLHRLGRQAPLTDLPVFLRERQTAAVA